MYILLTEYNKLKTQPTESCRIDLGRNLQVNCKVNVFHVFIDTNNRNRPSLEGMQPFMLIPTALFAENGCPNLKKSRYSANIFNPYGNYNKKKGLPNLITPFKILYIFYKFAFNMIEFRPSSSFWGMNSVGKGSAKGHPVYPIK